MNMHVVSVMIGSSYSPLKAFTRMTDAMHFMNVQSGRVISNYSVSTINIDGL